MTKITRTPTKATGGITPEEKLKMDESSAFWIKNAMRTDTVDRERLTDATLRLYAAAGLKKPRVVIVPSPKVMAFAGVLSACVWELRKRGATDVATRGATLGATAGATDAATYGATLGATTVATYGATDAATAVATDVATYWATAVATYGATDVATASATDAATREATDGATYGATAVATDAATYWATAVATASATDAATDEATYAQWMFALCSSFVGEKFAPSVMRQLPNWYRMYQGGNMWSGSANYYAACRDILGLTGLSCWEKYQAWEDCAIEGGFRIMHDEFCMVSDRPEILRVDDQNRAHCENGPSHRWRDGWSLYHWHGVSIPGEWVTGKPPSAQEAMTWPNIEQRRAACEIVGWNNILKQLDATVIDEDGDDEIGILLEVDLPESGKERFLKVMCGTKREFCIPVPKDMASAIQANAWTYGLNANEFKPEVRT